MYGIQLWGCKYSNHLIIQRIQNIIIRTITNAKWYQSNDDLHKDLELQSVDEITRKTALKHKDRLCHSNVEAVQLLDTKDDLRRLKRTKPLDLTL